MGTIKADTVTGLADPNKVTLPNNPSIGSTTATLNFGNTVIANASAGSTTITGEGGSNTTNIQQGLCKMWVNFDMINGNVNRDSLNVSSINDDQTGTATYTYTTAMNATDNIAVTNGHRAEDFEIGVRKTSNNAASIQSMAHTTSGDGDSNVDSDSNYIAVFGDLA